MTCIPRMAIAVVVATAALVVGVSSVGTVPTGSLVASSTACPGSDSARVSRTERRAAFLCLLNYARDTLGLDRVRDSRTLSRVARLKARDVVACGRFEHSPCGAPVFSRAMTSSSFRRFGENLFYGTRPIVSARDVFEAWLASPPHRQVMFLPAFDHAGTAVFELRRFAGSPRVDLWVLELGQRHPR